MRRIFAYLLIIFLCWINLHGRKVYKGGSVGFSHGELSDGLGSHKPVCAPINHYGFI